jgi:hypothetical protein
MAQPKNCPHSWNELATFLEKLQKKQPVKVVEHNTNKSWWDKDVQHLEYSEDKNKDTEPTKEALELFDSEEDVEDQEDLEDENFEEPEEEQEVYYERPLPARQNITTIEEPSDGKRDEEAEDNARRTKRKYDTYEEALANKTRKRPGV